MTQAEFWNIIAKADGLTDPEAVNETIKTALEALEPEEIVSYQTHFDALHDKAYTWKLWGAIYLLNGGCGDDAFIDFRSSLISMGEAMYTRTVNDPDSLADLDHDPEDCYSETLFNEAFGYLAYEVYEDKIGEDMDNAIPEPASEVEMGEEWDFDDREACQQYLPRLTQKYHS